ncbi:hypothetical protein B0H15DRAFT_943804 [Mycena belliarum]|uniref:Uncharacterized protein n=1 Tax=Mycena belliarum TaxID=1033014 RepID=A0AAD6UGC7_9AGAR|nr:hypothetical protein B0H15DRAFT_943804 [Mycena belliae]
MLVFLLHAQRQPQRVGGREPGTKVARSERSRFSSEKVHRFRRVRDSCASSVRSLLWVRRPNALEAMPEVSLQQGSGVGVVGAFQMAAWDAATPECGAQFFDVIDFAEKVLS